MIARPKISRNEWKSTEIGAFEVGNFALFSCPGYRSVVNTFAGANPAAFHAADGGGYDFVRDEVIATDKLNPQVAARLAGAFGNWRKFDAPRQAKMKACLEAIRDAEGLSKDTYEIASRSLK